MRLHALICGIGLLRAIPVHADLYLWTDTEGTVHGVDDRSGVPEEYQEQVKVYREVKRPPSPESPAIPPSPDIYTETPEVYYEVLAAARRGADSRRLSLSADGAEAVVRLAASSFLPSSSIARAVSSSDEMESGTFRYHR